MTDMRHDIEMLVSIARVDGASHNCQASLSRIPEELGVLEKKIAGIDERRASQEARLEKLQKERRSLEAAVQDHEANITESKTKLTQVKTNQEYTAVLKEIDDIKKAIDGEEERLLELMDELEQFEPEHKADMEKIARERAELEAERNELLQKEAALKEEAARLDREKPRFLADLSDPLQRQYKRLLARYGDVAVVPVIDEHCGGCRSQIPPQVAVEVKNNDRLITCPLCGRILVYYNV